MVFGDNIERCWAQITDHESAGEPTREVQPSGAADAPEALVPTFRFDGDEEIIRDERGVRLAKVVELED